MTFFQGFSWDIFLVAVLTAAVTVAIIVGLSRKLSAAKAVLRATNMIACEPWPSRLATILTDELRRLGLEVLGFFQTNPTAINGPRLESDRHSIPLLVPSTPVKALFSMQPFPIDPGNKTDASIIALEKDPELSFIPFQMKPSSPCWKALGCSDKQCGAHNRTDHCACWVASDLRFRGRTLASYDEKAKNCLFCSQFLPVGVFMVKGPPAIIEKGFEHVRENFEEHIRTVAINRGMTHLATRDTLTGLWNRRYLMQNLKMLFSMMRRYQQPFCVCMVDVDHFKIFNDTYGHATGDVVLRWLATVMTMTVREADVACRFGGEEFTLIFPNATKDQAMMAAEKVRKAVEGGSVPSSFGDLKVTISAGVASALEDKSASPDGLIKDADSALYLAKESGRNRVAAFLRAASKASEEKVIAALEPSSGQGTSGGKKNAKKKSSGSGKSRKGKKVTTKTDTSENGSSKEGDFD